MKSRLIYLGWCAVFVAALSVRAVLILIDATRTIVEE